jgi:hypothetical protein
MDDVDVPTTKWDTERPNCKSLWVTRKKGIKVRLLIKAFKEKNLSKPKHGSFSINNPTGIRRQRKIVLKNTLKAKNEDQINTVRNLQFYISFKVLHKMQTTKFVVAIRLDRENLKGVLL